MKQICSFAVKNSDEVNGKKLISEWGWGQCNL